MSRKQYRQTTVTLDIDVSDIMNDLNDETIKAEYKDRFGALPSPPFEMDLLAELHWQLTNGHVQSALALIVSAQEATRITEERRQHQYQLEGRVQ